MLALIGAILVILYAFGVEVDPVHLGWVGLGIALLQLVVPVALPWRRD